jgi:hypothetical protein
MRYRMLKTQRAAPDGIESVTYHEGREYEIADGNIVQAFYEAGAIEEVDETKPEPVARETKPEPVKRTKRRGKV